MILAQHHNINWNIKVLLEHFCATGTEELKNGFTKIFANEDKSARKNLKKKAQLEKSSES